MKPGRPSGWCPGFATNPRFIASPGRPPVHADLRVLTECFYAVSRSSTADWDVTVFNDLNLRWKAGSATLGTLACPPHLRC